MNSSFCLSSFPILHFFISSHFFFFRDEHLLIYRYCVVWWNWKHFRYLTSSKVNIVPQSSVTYSSQRRREMIEVQYCVQASTISRIFMIVSYIFHHYRFQSIFWTSGANTRDNRGIWIQRRNRKCWPNKNYKWRSALFVLIRIRLSNILNHFPALHPFVHNYASRILL